MWNVFTYCSAANGTGWTEKVSGDTWPIKHPTEDHEEDKNKEKLLFCVSLLQIWIKPLKVLDICPRLSSSRSNSCCNYLQGKALMEFLFVSEPRCCRREPAATSPEHPWRLSPALFPATATPTQTQLTVSSEAGWEPLLLKTMAQDSIWAEESNLVCESTEMFLDLVCVITMIAVMMIMHPFCPPWNERWNKLM